MQLFNQYSYHNLLFVFFFFLKKTFLLHLNQGLFVFLVYDHNKLYFNIHLRKSRHLIKIQKNCRKYAKNGHFYRFFKVLLI